jgi:hypothetical protein
LNKKNFKGTLCLFTLVWNDFSYWRRWESKLYQIVVTLQERKM